MSQMMSRRGKAPPKTEYTVKPKGSQFKKLSNSLNFTTPLSRALDCAVSHLYRARRTLARFAYFPFAKEYIEGYEPNVLANQNARNNTKNIRIKALIQ